MIEAIIICVFLSGSAGETGCTIWNLLQPMTVAAMEDLCETVRRDMASEGFTVDGCEQWPVPEQADRNDGYDRGQLLRPHA